ncbi:MAG: hypothetical protein QM796_09255 [Chthoniobacteraceae bacterium]
MARFLKHRLAVTFPRHSRRSGAALAFEMQVTGGGHPMLLNPHCLYRHERYGGYWQIEQPVADPRIVP